MINIAIFASGNGSNYEAITKYFMIFKEYNVKLLICDKKDAYVLQRAEKLRTTYVTVDYRAGKIAAEKEILNELEKQQIDIVFLAGFMRILSREFLEKVNINVINIHPSLLPKYKGMNAIQKAYDAGDSEIGISIHYVSDEVDSGEIILQKKIPLEKEKGIEYVEEQVHNLEHEWYPKVAKELCDRIR